MDNLKTNSCLDAAPPRDCRTQLCLYGHSRCHQPSSSFPRQFPQCVERSEYRCPGVPL
ncbi:hypothetical protein DPMN_048199 [Dreissena polymorpha]|uniref:Uncharacterized protein n=1 Tax=Dreissena polymorpha TaxID=45954 RepID=A0A9D4I249_DREPO|nr:hypothetical protein DPMN_048199 [Dreissena polymorpha]